MNIRFACAFVAVLLSTTAIAFSQTTPSPVFVNTVSTEQALPSRFEDRVLVRGTINGRELWFQLDTGLQGMELTKDAIDQLNLAPSSDDKIYADMRIGGLRGYHMPFAIDPDDEVGDGTQISGRIGSPFFQSSVVQLDFLHQIVRVFPMARFVPPTANVNEAPISILGRVPFVHAWFGEKRAAMLLDTGTATTSLFDKFAKGITLTVPSGDDTGAQMLGQEDAVASLVPYQAPSLAIGGLRIRDVSVLLKHEQRVFDPGVYADGTLGRDILSNFVVTLDYPDSKAYFAY